MKATELKMCFQEIGNNIGELKKLIEKKEGNVHVMEGGWFELINSGKDWEVFYCEFEGDAVVKLHSHAGSLEIFNIIEGKAIITIGDRAYHCERGSSVTASEGMDHEFEFIEDTRMLTIAIPPLEELKT